MGQEYLIALGSNLGSEFGAPAETVQAALRAIKDAGFRLRRVSRFFATPCFPAGAGPDYVNACAAVALNGAGAADVLARLHAIEADFGRARVQRWGSRTLDLDLIAAGDAVLPDAETHAAWRALPLEDQKRRAPDRLVLPHPRLQERAFVLVPLRDVAAGWRHPVLGTTVAAMTDALPDDMRQEVLPL